MMCSCEPSVGAAVAGKLLITALACIASAAAMADGPPMIEPMPYSPQVDVRPGGVLAESYGYHRQVGQEATIAPPGGWYHYGFPVSTYRWGWFGAERYYPNVFWYRGYYDDCCRTGYRCGY